MQDQEGRDGAKRVEAFSDGVIAIIVTIMVLELHAPERPGLAALAAQWPVFLAYALSYAYVAIYWVNHHKLFQFATRAGNALLWSNIVLLFTLSLIPFATAYLGEQHFSGEATLIYMAVMLLPSFAYNWLQRVIRRTGAHSAEAERYHRRTLRKSTLACGLYLVGLALAVASPAAGLACAALVALLWCLADGPLDRLFER
ncbi:TMEM175 family protein [uncultured Sphingomonas sp.]|uniref:TMEM175 family protein n=1 Tax=uncultured Sphingomonas sp. TaxID=158754 RepID=UPI0025FA378B|nr:TMEM175 family protein [uncultured Sphingomonas sp.]